MDSPLVDELAVETARAGAKVELLELRDGDMLHLLLPEGLGQDECDRLLEHWAAAIEDSGLDVRVVASTTPLTVIRVVDEGLTPIEVEG